MEFLTRFFGKENASKDVAKERLRLVLVHDRANISPQVMDSIREDIVKAISRYMDIDETKMEVDLTNSANAVALTANIPVRKVRRGNEG